MRIIWTPAAAQDRADIWDYLYTVNPKAAVDMDDRFTEAMSRLSLFRKRRLQGSSLALAS